MPSAPPPALPPDALLLGIESSCDDAAAAVVRGDRRVLSSVVMGQEALHRAFGGVVPEIAARAHAETLDHAVEAALSEASVSLRDLHGIAVTAGPGLIGGVLAGVMTAKGLAAATGLPLWGVNHLAGHALSPRLSDGLAFPYLLLLVSGGHCQILVVRSATRFERLGGTIDDAPGEAFDKVARSLGLEQPGGPAVAREAQGGDPSRVPLPRPLLDRPGCDLSFSGLKTAALRARDGLLVGGALREADRRDLCAAFEAAVADVLAEKARRAALLYLAGRPPAPALAVAGGVGANAVLRARLLAMCEDLGMAFAAPPPALCTDNGAMIAWAGIERARAGVAPDAAITARPRWPLDEEAAPMLGAGRKGARA